MSEIEDHGSAAITRLLRDWRAGDEAALPQLTTAVYRELRRLAAAIMARRSGNPTIQPTVLVHELYLQLPGVREFDWKSRAQFLAVAAKMMRNILVDHARRRQSAKRGGNVIAVTADPAGEDRATQIDVLLVHNALEDFAVAYPRQARVVELRFFGGLTAEETSEVLRATGTDSSVRTVERDWTFARAWLQDAIGSS